MLNAPSLSGIIFIPPEAPKPACRQAGPLKGALAPQDLKAIFN